MSGYIQISKDLVSDIRFRRVVRAYIASLKRHASDAKELSFETGVTHVLGALAQLWMYADTHICDDNTIEGTTDEINEIVGIAGFCELLPADWFQVVDSECVQLTDFLQHNGTVAKKNANHAKRQARYRERQKAAANDATESRDETPSDASASPSHPIPSHPNPSEEARARAADARPGAGLIGAGSRLTQLSVSTLEDWRRDVPECNPDAFAKWIIHVELSGKPMSAAMRLAQARRLAGYGNFAEQLEIVQFCADEKGYHTLIPLADVRLKTKGMSRDGKRAAAAVPSDAERLEKLKANRVGCAWLKGFRDPNPGESPKEYLEAQNAEHRRWEEEHGRDRSRVVADLAASKRLV